MKKIYTILAAASVVLAASCTKETGAVKDAMIVKFTASVAETKAEFNPTSLEDGASVPVLWQSGDKLDVYVNEHVLPSLVKEIEVTPSDDCKTATWECDFSQVYDGTEFGGFVPGSPYSFYAFYPGEKIRAFYNEQQSRVRVNVIPSTQQPSENSCDKSAMMLCSISDSYEQWPESVSMPNFVHMTAYGCLTIGEGIPADVNIKQVIISANDGQYLAGDAWYYYAGEKAGTWEDFSSGGTETIIIETKSKENIWFACRPTPELGSLTFGVYADNGDYYEVVKDLTDKNLKFTSGKVSKMTITGFEKIRSGEGRISYTLNSTALHGIIGGNYSLEVTEKSGVYGNDGETKLTIASVATLTGEVKVNDASGRLKFGTGTAVMSDFSIVITPEDGWIVESITVNSAVASGKKYSLVAKVGDNVLINVDELTTANVDYTNETENKVAGPVNVMFHGNKTGVFYISSISVTLASAN